MLTKIFRRVTFPVKARWLAGALRRITERGTPTRGDIARLALAWGNPGYAAGIDYLSLVGRRAAQTEGPVLECGSGATTLLIGALTARRKIRVVALEHNPDWHQYLSTLLEFLGYDHVRLQLAPLARYGQFDWYAAPEVEQTNSPNYRLVVCDGPPGRTAGGRYGLLPVMGRQLARDCTILLDDTHRNGEQQVIDQWRQEVDLIAQRLGRFGRFAEVTLC